MFRIFTCAAVLCILAAAQDAGLATRLDPKISSLLAASGAPSVSVAVVVDGSLAYKKAFGQADGSRSFEVRSVLIATSAAFTSIEA